MNWNDLALKYTQETLEFIKASKDVAITQGSIYIQELIKLEIYLSILNILGSFVLLTLAYLIYKKLKNTEYLEDKPEIFIPFGTLLVISTIMGGTILTKNSQTLIKATVAPRVLVIENLSNTIKGK